MSGLLPRRHLSCRTGGRKRGLKSADKVGDNLEHCQFKKKKQQQKKKPVRVTLSDRTKEEQSHREGVWEKKIAHKLNYWWAKMIVFVIVL